MYRILAIVVAIVAVILAIMLAYTIFMGGGGPYDAGKLGLGLAVTAGLFAWLNSRAR